MPSAVEITVILGVLLGLLVLMSVRQLRLAGRIGERCLRCGYRLRGLNSSHCPECGCTIGEQKRHFLAERKRLRLVHGGLLIAAAMLGFLILLTVVQSVLLPIRVRWIYEVQIHGDCLPSGHGARVVGLSETWGPARQPWMRQPQPERFSVQLHDAERSVELLTVRYDRDASTLHLTDQTETTSDALRELITERLRRKDIPQSENGRRELAAAISAAISADWDAEALELKTRIRAPSAGDCDPCRPVLVGVDAIDLSSEPVRAAVLVVSGIGGLLVLIRQLRNES